MIAACSVGEAMKAALARITEQRKKKEAEKIAIAQAAGHAAATVHTSDHSLITAWYALEVAKKIGISIEQEKSWQNEKLPTRLQSLILDERKSKD
jgi:hypothetical protein